MASDPDKPLLRLLPQQEQNRPVGQPKAIPRPAAFPQGRQIGKFSPKFTRLAELLARDASSLELRADPAALAPERLLVFEVKGPIGQFAAAIRRVPGLELVDEEELISDEDKAPVAYLLVPDMQALRQLESLWRRWQQGQLILGETPWRDVFELLRDLRPWGPADRVRDDEAILLNEEIEDLADDASVRIEVELVYRANADTAGQREHEVVDAIARLGGIVLSRARIVDIAYHALLVEVPVRAVRAIVARNPDGVAGLEPVMHIRPQSLATTIEVEEAGAQEDRDGAGDLGQPILALLDGVPLAAHRLITDHVTVDDQFNLEPQAAVADRKHGTAMASLIVHGDRNSNGAQLPRRIHVVPVMGARDQFPGNRLVVDLIYNAIVRMRGGAEATAPQVLIVNLSLGNARQRFHGQMSAWARLVDRLAYRFGLLFVVSAGNRLDPFAIPAYATSAAFEDAAAAERANETLRGLGALMGERRMFSPAETVNGVTVGASNLDSVSAADRQAARAVVDPYGNLLMANPSSALGPGFAQSVKPDLLLAGAKEHLRFVRNDPHIFVTPAGPTRGAGLKVAAPPVGGRENVDGYTSGTSAAAALASRTAHRIHDALELTYGEAFLGLPALQRAVLLKALLVHPAKWPEGTAVFIKGILGPVDPKLNVRQKENIRRFLGYGCLDPEDAVACAADRATFWAAGSMHSDKIVDIRVPVPAAMSGQARTHFLAATLAWFAPTSPGRKSYRAVRLKILEPNELDVLRVKAHSQQPDTNQSNRGTLFTRYWTGERSPAVAADQTITMQVQRDPDQGQVIDEAVPFGLAVTLAMPGELRLYEQARARSAVAPRAPA